MRRLLIILTVLSLITLGGFLKFNKISQTLRQQTHIPDEIVYLDQQAIQKDFVQQEVTISEWMICQISKYQPFDCMEDEDTEAFFDKISALESSSECKDFKNYRYESSFNQAINFNNFYQNCYLSPLAQSIANSSSCIKEFYDLVYVQCAGL